MEIKIKGVIEKWYRKLSFPQNYDEAFQLALQKANFVLPTEFISYNPQLHDPTENLLAYLYYCEELEKTYKRLGINDCVLLDTLSDIVIWVKHWFSLSGELGLGETKWLKNHLTASLFRLGRLQFCFYEFEKGYPTIGAKKGENVIAIHIPMDGKLSKEACTRSFQLAESFFNKYFSDFHYRFYSCNSWLLDSELSRFIGENSNVRFFAKLFTEIEKKEDDAILRYVFHWNATRENIDNYENTTTLALGLKEAVRKEEPFFKVFGVIKREDI